MLKDQVSVKYKIVYFLCIIFNMFTILMFIKRECLEMNYLKKKNGLLSLVNP